MLESQPPNPKTRYFYETHTRRGVAPNQTESIQGTRSRPRLAPEDSGTWDFGWSPRPPRTGWFGS